MSDAWALMRIPTGGRLESDFIARLFKQASYPK